MENNVNSTQPESNTGPSPSLLKYRLPYQSAFAYRSGPSRAADISKLGVLAGKIAVPTPQSSLFKQLGHR